MRMLIVAKQSKVEWEQDTLGLGFDDLLAKYRAEHANLPAILESHEHQLRMRGELRNLLPAADFCLTNALNNEMGAYDLVLSLGGDNSFTQVSHFVGAASLMGVNVDPKRSTGALCAWSALDLEGIAQAIRDGDYRIEEWPRIEGEIDGVPMTEATSEYFFGEEQRTQMSRHIMVHRGREYEQKSSGIILATGAGSTGWYRSVSNFLPGGGQQVAKTEPKAVYVVTEPYNYQAGRDPLLGEILPGEEMQLHSLNDSRGIASVDSWEQYDFSRGKKAVLRISLSPLRVIVPRSL